MKPIRLGRLTGCCASNAGTAALEFGLIAPVLVTILLGGTDLSMMTNQVAKLDAAVRAGAASAVNDPTDPSSAIENAVIGYTTFSPTLAISNVTVSAAFCECDDASHPTSSVSPNYCTTSSGANATCTTGPVHYYMTITAKQPFTPIIPFSALVVPSVACPVTVGPCLTATVTARVL